MSSLQDRVDGIRALQGAHPVERDLLTSPITVYSPTVSTPGANETMAVLLQGGREAFHKTFAGVNVTLALAYGQSADSPPVHECVAWRMAAILGTPYDELAAVSVMRAHAGNDGALIDRCYGIKGPPAAAAIPAPMMLAAAFFDSVIAQQDRHTGNFRWDPNSTRLGLFDHGYSFAVPHDYFNASQFVGTRWAKGLEQLAQTERDLLTRLAGSPDLMGLNVLLEPARAAAVRDRIERMFVNGTILRPGEF